MKNFFKIFQIEEKFAIDLDLLEAKYLEFQRNFHPDKAGIAEIEKSILINEGYDVLNDDFRRAAHLLKLKGIDVENDSKAPKVDFATLEEIFEMQEDPSLIDEKIIKLKIKELFSSFEKDFNGNNLEKAAQDLMRVKYYRKLINA